MKTEIGWVKARIAALKVGLFLNLPALAATSPTFSDANWTALGSGMNNTVRALAESGSNVFAGGLFTMAGRSHAHYVVRRDGNRWDSHGLGMNSTVYALAPSGS